MAVSQTRITRVPFGSRQINAHKSDNVHFFINLTFKGKFPMILTIGGVNLGSAALRLEGTRRIPLQQQTHAVPGIFGSVLFVSGKPQDPFDQGTTRCAEELIMLRGGNI